MEILMLNGETEEINSSNAQWHWRNSDSFNQEKLWKNLPEYRSLFEGEENWQNQFTQ